jgi:hypothetical protein
LRRRWNQTGASQAGSSWHLPSSFHLPFGLELFPPVARSLPPNQSRPSGGVTSLYNKHTPAAVVCSVTEVKPKVHPITCHEGSEKKDIHFYSFFNLDTKWDGGKLNAPAALPPKKRPGIHFTAGWVGPNSELDGCGKFCPHRDSIPRSSSS